MSYRTVAGVDVMFCKHEKEKGRHSFVHQIVVLNAHAPTEDKPDDSEDRFYDELECGFDPFPTYHLKIPLGNLNAKLGREDEFKITTGNESLYENINNNGGRVTNLPIPVAERSTARVCGRSPAGIAGSNPAGDMGGCLL